MCKSGIRKRELSESDTHRERMARLEKLRRLREQEGLEPGRGEDLLTKVLQYKYATPEPQNVKSLDAQNIREMLRKKFRESDDGDNRQNYKTDIQGCKAYHQDDKPNHQIDKISSRAKHHHNGNNLSKRSHNDRALPVHASLNTFNNIVSSNN
ncbi:unnamed protein product [Thelazia callipaeda]|uniref:SAP domain-containing protein n=1 Tax=Thelazia callipaeda TaxID=103827 RepID=A0A0N5D5N2_THECL|nr:unnamed protein product [Thelazia callipaeda]